MHNSQPRANAGSGIHASHGTNPAESRVLKAIIYLEILASPLNHREVSSFFRHFGMASLCAVAMATTSGMAPKGHT